jgi:hypothetical protein
MLRTLVFTAAVWLLAGPSTAWAWGCDGHQAIAIAAERRLPAATLATLNAVLAASPISPALSRFCDKPSSPLADAATWADDFRAVDPATGDWHFINVPRASGQPASTYSAFCPRGDCVVDVIVAQFRILKTAREPARKANAVRFLTHFIGDLHQPLHAITNGDRGGNCFPVNDGAGPPLEDERHNWRPNLHSLWDVELVRRLMRTRALRGTAELATFITAGSGPVPAQVPTPQLVESWARESNEVARQVAYGRLPVSVPIESAKSITLASCDDNNHVGGRIAALNERMTPAYQQAGERAVADRLRVAAIRLASVLRAAFE